jgi:hypothetical protein
LYCLKMDCEVALGRDETLLNICGITAFGPSKEANQTNQGGINYGNEN